LDDLAEVARHEGNDLDAAGRDHRVERPGDGAADQQVDAELGEPARPPDRAVVLQGLGGFPEDAAGVGLHEVDPVGRVEDRSDPVVPCRERGACHSLPP
jgi:hypothetical protein